MVGKLMVTCWSGKCLAWHLIINSSYIIYIFIWCAHAIRDERHFKKSYEPGRKDKYHLIKAFPGNILQCSMKSAKEKKGQGDTNSIRHDPLSNPNQLKGSEIFYPPTSPFYPPIFFFWRQNIFRYKCFLLLKGCTVCIIRRTECNLLNSK